MKQAENDEPHRDWTARGILRLVKGREFTRPAESWYISVPPDEPDGPDLDPTAIADQWEEMEDHWDNTPSASIKLSAETCQDIVNKWYKDKPLFVDTLRAAENSE